MCLVDDGLIGLNRPFIDYVPEWDVPGVAGLADARVADLCATPQGSMISAGTTSTGPRRVGRTATARTRAAPDAQYADPPGRRRSAGLRPGTAMLYSSMGYPICSAIVRRVSSRPFWQFVQSRIFEPLGMHELHGIRAAASVA